MESFEGLPLPNTNKIATVDFFPEIWRDLLRLDLYWIKNTLQTGVWELNDVTEQFEMKETGSNEGPDSRLPRILSLFQDGREYLIVATDQGVEWAVTVKDGVMIDQWVRQLLDTGETIETHLSFLFPGDVTYVKATKFELIAGEFVKAEGDFETVYEIDHKSGVFRLEVIDSIVTKLNITENGFLI